MQEMGCFQRHVGEQFSDVIGVDRDAHGGGGYGLGRRRLLTKITGAFY